MSDQFVASISKEASLLDVMRQPLVAGVLARLRKDAWFFCAVLAYTFFALVYMALVGDTRGTSHIKYVEPGLKLFALLLPLMAISVDAIMVVHRFGRRRRLAFKRTFSTKRLSSLLAGVLLLAGVVMFQGSFTTIKTSMPLMFGGFPYDTVQANIDKFLHFGVDPWRLVHAVLGEGIALKIISFNYGIGWGALCFGVLFWVATSPRADDIRARYLVMFMFSWVAIGNVLAGAFLSAGPIYYGHVTGDYARFGDLVEFMGTTAGSKSIHGLQQYLWSLYQKDIAGLGSGISAFPSVHVSTVTMNALFIYERSRLWGAVAFANVALVAASSVYLGWHYAIDGYVSIVVVVLAHILVRRWFASRAQRKQEPVGALAKTPNLASQN